MLQGEEKFAIAPPTGVSPYARAAASEELAQLDGDELARRRDGRVVRGQHVAREPVLRRWREHDRADVRHVERRPITSLGGERPSAPRRPAGACRASSPTSKTGEPLAGVTVVATSPALSQTQTAITDEKGYYKIADLPPGNYLVTFYYADLTRRAARRPCRRRQDRVGLPEDRSEQGRRRDDPRRRRGADASIATSTRRASRSTRTTSKNIPVPGRTFDAALGAAAGQQATASVVALGSHPRLRRRPSQAQGRCKLARDRRQSDREQEGRRDRGPRRTARGDVAARAPRSATSSSTTACRPRASTSSPHDRPERARALRVLAVAPRRSPRRTAPPTAARGRDCRDTPVGESHFIADRPMNVQAPARARWSRWSTARPTGGVVYLYDPISDRGDKRFAFKAVRLDNPTGDTLEPGPVTVYGDGRFIGEGITEPVPPHASVVVPFALDRQIVVERTDAEADRIAKLVTAQRGVVTAEVQHRRETTIHGHQPARPSRRRSTCATASKAAGRWSTRRRESMTRRRLAAVRGRARRRARPST